MSDKDIWICIEFNVTITCGQQFSLEKKNKIINKNFISSKIISSKIN